MLDSGQYFFGNEVADISYANGKGGTDSGVNKLPFSATVEMSPGDAAFVTAGLRYPDNGTIRVSIIVPGLELRKAESTGPHASASAQGLLPR